MDEALGIKLIELRDRVVSNFDAGNWDELGLMTGTSDIIDKHPRLLRSLSWGDEDYDGSALAVLRIIVSRKPNNFGVVEGYVKNRFPEAAQYISARPSEKKITFAPSVFSIPDSSVELDLVAVMMPFSAEFHPVYEAIKLGCSQSNLRCLRADDIWEDSVIMQDVFNLIFRAQVVLVDFTGKNPNVMYETGIAHTLGKHVIPITQAISDLPSDAQHHRALKYLPNNQGMTDLAASLAKKLQQFSPGPSW